MCNVKETMWKIIENKAIYAGEHWYPEKTQEVIMSVFW